MKLLYTYLSFLLIAFTFAQTLDVNPITDELSIRDTSGATSEEIEVANYLQQLVVAAGLDSQNLTKRDYPDNSLLTAAFTSLNRSGVGVQLVHTFATSSATQGTTINTVGQYVSVTGLTKLLTSANKSGLAVSIVMRFFINYSLVPGLWNVIVALWNNGVISLGKRGLLDLVGGIINGVQQSIINSLITIINSVTDLTQICSSLNNSGLAVSIVDDLLTTSDGQNFVVKLATNLVQKGIVTFDKLLSSLQSSGIIVDTFTTIIGNSTYRKIIFIWAVKSLVGFIKYIF